jgi:hypothetical protein
MEPTLDELIYWAERLRDAALDVRRARDALDTAQSRYVAALAAQSDATDAWLEKFVPKSHNGE